MGGRPHMGGLDIGQGVDTQRERKRHIKFHSSINNEIKCLCSFGRSKSLNY